MRSARSNSIIAMLMVSITAAGSLSAAETPDKGGIEAITLPSGDRTLSFVRPGLIMEMPIDKGDPVKKDQVVAKQDDREEQQLLLSAKKESEDETEINAEKAVKVADEAERDKLRETRGAAPTEVRAAELKVVVDEARIKLAIFKKEKAQYQYAANGAAIEKLKLISPIDGVVAEVFMKAGEATNGQDMKVMRVVQVDPLWIEVPVPLQQARNLNPGDAVHVRFQDGKIRQAKVALKDRVANAASGTLNVRVAVPNPEKIEPGEVVRVTFGPAAVAGVPAGQ